MEAIILHIETSTTVCSLALSRGAETLLSLKSSEERPVHASLLGKYVEEAAAYLREQGGIALDAVAVSIGPGSYTGLRIGLSMAKGLCFGSDVPLIVVPTLEVLAQSALAHVDAVEGIALRPMLDARRMEVYTACYSHTLEQVESVSSQVVDENSFEADRKAYDRCYIFGDGAAKCAPLLESDGAPFSLIEGIEPLATSMIPLALARFAAGDFADVAYCEPFYLKEFQATVGKNKVLDGLVK